MSTERSEKPCVPHHTGKPLENTRSLGLEKKWLKQQPCVQGEGGCVAPSELGSIRRNEWEAGSKQVEREGSSWGQSSPGAPGCRMLQVLKVSKGKWDKFTEKKPAGAC